MKSRSAWITGLWLLAVWIAAPCTAPAAAASGHAGASGGDDPPITDGSRCPYCKSDPALMGPAGIVSHGPFPFGAQGPGDTGATGDAGGTGAAGGSQRIAASFSDIDIYWIESAHVRIGLAVGDYKLDVKEKKTILPETNRLRVIYPNIPEKPTHLDPWLRTHLFAQRCEDLWQRMLAILAVKESDFPDGGAPWDMTTKYMGNGPFLGMKDKYEILVLPSQNALSVYLEQEFGLLVTHSQRWHEVRREALSATISLDHDQNRKDRGLHCHMVFNLAHNFLDGYKHYSYDTPVWLHAGLAHYLEREIDPNYNSFDLAEGAVERTTGKSNWLNEVRSLLARGQAPRLARLVSLQGYGEIELPDHFTTWSMVKFLVEVHPAAFACINDRIHGRWNDRMPDGSNMEGVQRDAFLECLGMSYAQFDTAWAAWVADQVAKEKEKEKKGGDEPVPGPPDGVPPVPPLPPGGGALVLPGPEVAGRALSSW